MKKKTITAIILFILVIAGIAAVLFFHSKQEPDFDEFAEKFEKAAEEALNEDITKVSKTELVATMTYGHETEKDNNIYYRILKTTYYEGGDPDTTR